MRRLLTIGYEGADLYDFVDTLVEANVNVLLDVRELPISRRKGFSKSALRQALDDVGINYMHEPKLGSPRDVRHKLREDGDYETFFSKYKKHLSAHNMLLQKLARELTGTVVLMCYERDHDVCHRSSVGIALAKLTNKKPTHLKVQNNECREAAYS